MPARCLDLDDPAARKSARVGAKAAGLARARAGGLPVLPGVVVPVDESAGVVAAATGAPGGRGGTGARLATMQVRPDEPLLTELRRRVASFPSPLIVRSSSPLEADGTWSGAFSSFHDVGPDDLGTAVRGCWGSAFAVGVLDRARRTGTAPERLGLAVLVQPQVAPTLGGTARRLADGSVRVTATRGPLRPLMAGHVEGETAVVTDSGDVLAGRLDPAVLHEVAALSRRVHDLLGHTLVEWAAADGRVVLLQSLASPDTPAVQAGDAPPDPVLGDPVAVRVAGLALRFPGRLADELVLPWAVAAAQVPPLSAATPGGDPVAALATARAEASRLTTRVWGGSPRAAAAEADRVLRQLRGDDPAPALARVAALAGPAPDAVGALLRALAVVREALVAGGRVESDEALWRLGPDDAACLLAGGAVAVETRLGVDRWEPFVHGVVTAAGTSYRGVPAAPGAGAGRAHVVTDPRLQVAPRGRYVLVAPEPVPALGPLLWNAAGLVTRAGSTAAHLIEFAHSIGVPTVVGCELPRLSPDDPPLVAVDGASGRVSLAWPR